MSVLGKIRGYLGGDRGDYSVVHGEVFRDIPISNEKAWNPTLWALGGSQSLSGEVVTEYTAMNYSAVWNAVNLISGTVGSLPLHLMQRKGDRKQIADSQRIYTVMHDQANPYMTAMTLRETLMSHVLTWGNGYAEIVRNPLNEVVALWPITPNRVRIDMKSGVLFYVVRVDNTDIPIARENMLHLYGLGFDGFQGYSVISQARKSLGLGMALETFGAKYFGEGTHPGIIVSHPGKLSTTAHQNLRESLAEKYSGLGNAHRIMLMEEGMKPEKIGIPPDDSQFLESRQFQIPEVARWFNLPPHKLKDLTKSSFNNIESEQISFVTDSILPWLVRLEQNYNMQLLDRYDKALSGYGRLYFKHAVEGLLRGNSESRAKFYQTMFNVGAFSVNDIRALEDMDPVTGGDERFVPMNMIPLSMVREKWKAELENLEKEDEPAPANGKGNGKADDMMMEEEDDGEDKTATAD